jgi:hypothetical protein
MLKIGDTKHCQTLIMVLHISGHLLSARNIIAMNIPLRHIKIGTRDSAVG